MDRTWSYEVAYQERCIVDINMIKLPTISQSDSIKW